jgi:hypothetical protein
VSTRYSSIRPGQVWLDTTGHRIQAHGGSIFQEGERFYWYGENKERTAPGSAIWHWGVRCYESTDLYNWTDLGLLIPPHPDDPASSLHPERMVDRPHIVRSRATGRYVCWLKVMYEDGTQRSTVLTAERFLGPYTVVCTDLRPLGMSAGDFDLVVDPHDGKTYTYFERVHSELICADLSEDCTDVTGYYSTHFPYGVPPYVREAPAHFTRRGLHYLITSGTTGYVPNPSAVATAPTYHGPWTMIGDPHPADESRTSYNSQVTSVFKHPGKSDLYIALADRWLPRLPELGGDDFQSGRLTRRIASSSAQRNDPHGRFGDAQEFTDAVTLTPELVEIITMVSTDTSIADYVWLPIRFDGDMAYLDWYDEWRIEDFV